MVVSMDGRLNFEAQEPLRQDLTRLVSQTKRDVVPQKIIVNLEHLEFVGSSGISAFVQTMKEFNQRAPTKPRYVNVSSEFQRVMKAFDESGAFEFFDNEAKAKDSFSN